MSSEEIICKAQAFNHRPIFDRFKKGLHEKFGVADKETAENLKKECLRYLTLCALHPEKEISMFNEMVDEYWHTFLLFSREYFDFCHDLGIPYIHHYPNVSEEKPKEGATFSDFEKLYQETFEEDLPALWKTGKGKRCGGNGGRCSACSGACSANAKMPGCMTHERM